jgi:hypothetical protein
VGVSSRNFSICFGGLLSTCGCAPMLSAGGLLPASSRILLLMFCDCDSLPACNDGSLELSTGSRTLFCTLCDCDSLAVGDGGSPELSTGSRMPALVLIDSLPGRD